jgi:hypothetical protein
MVWTVSVWNKAHHVGDTACRNLVEVEHGADFVVGVHQGDQRFLCLLPSKPVACSRVFKSTWPMASLPAAITTSTCPKFPVPPCSMVCRPQWCSVGLLMIRRTPEVAHGAFDGHVVAFCAAGGKKYFGQCWRQYFAGHGFAGAFDQGRAHAAGLRHGCWTGCHIARAKPAAWHQ